MPSRIPWVALAAFRHHVRRFLASNEDVIRREGLEPGQHHLLLAVRALSLSGKPTIRQVSEQLVRRHHTTVELVDRLVKAKLIRRTPHSSDRRMVCLELTREGEAMLNRLTAALLEEYRVVAPELARALRSVVRMTAARSTARDPGRRRAGPPSTRPRGRGS